MKTALVLFCCTLALIAAATPAFAFTPHVGDRAAELEGRDVASKELFKLSEQTGQWVLVDYWAYT